MAEKHCQQQHKETATPAQMVPSSLYRSSCKERKKKKKLPSSHIRSVVLIETRCAVVKVCYCKLLSFSYNHDLKTHIKAVAWERYPQYEIVALKPFVSVQDDASRDIAQTPQAFTIILSVSIDPPRSPYFTHIYQQNAELLQLFLHSRPCSVQKRKFLSSAA